MHFHSAAQMGPVILHGDEILVSHLSVDKVKSGLQGYLPNITAIDRCIYTQCFTAVLLPAFTVQSDIRGSRGELSFAKCSVIYDSASLIMWVRSATSEPFLRSVIPLKSLTLPHRVADPGLLTELCRKKLCPL